MPKETVTTDPQADNSFDVELVDFSSQFPEQLQNERKREQSRKSAFSSKMAQKQ